ncbi:hypothetical protein AMECASPLE_008739 [Ameca splendens]|uniref:Uncharacterized protein n=1 Tax=Ameca splendens TaxID=208324 RepID=A0ABV0YY00_9TELE
MVDRRKMNLRFSRHLMGDIISLPGNKTQTKQTLILLKRGLTSTVENPQTKTKRHRWHEHCCYMTPGSPQCLSIMSESCDLNSVNMTAVNVYNIHKYLQSKSV